MFHSGDIVKVLEPEYRDEGWNHFYDDTIGHTGIVKKLGHWITVEIPDVFSCFDDHDFAYRPNELQLVSKFNDVELNMEFNDITDIL